MFLLHRLNPSVSVKLTAVLGIILALVIAVGLLGLTQLHKINRVAKDIRQIHLVQLETLQRIKEAIYFQHNLVATRWMQKGKPDGLSEATVGVTRGGDSVFDTAERAYLGSAAPEEQLAFADFRARWEAYRDTLRDVLTRQQGGQDAGWDHAFTTEVTGAFENAADALESLIGATMEKSGRAAAEADGMFHLAVLLTSGAIALALICAFIAIVWLRRSVVSPIMGVSNAMRRLTAGDEAVLIPTTSNRKDEIGTLIEATSGYRDALIASRKFAAAVEVEQERLQAAVSNMPIGLCMFDASARLIICNGAYADIYQLPPDLLKTGTALEDILRSRIEAGTLPADGMENDKAQIAAMVAAKTRIASTIELRDGRTISTALQPMPGGGWVAVHEDVTERRRAEERIAYMAHHDALTDLPNRVLFEKKTGDILKQIAPGEEIALMCLDLDRFKTVNDTLGHPVGDSLLRIAANRLKGCLREGDTVSRLGGDEFAMVQVGAEQPQSATATAQRIIDVLSAPYEIDGHQLIVGVSIGIAVAPVDGLELDVLFKNADLALYRAKAEGRGIFHFFEPTMDAKMQARRHLELDLRKGLARNEFELFYQPVVNLEQQQVTSVEALMRWRHPEKGMISPAEFVPVAEEIELIVPLGAWALHQACRDAARWPDHVKVSVNLSPVQFRNAKLIDTVKSALSEARLLPWRLELEITEGVLLAETEATLAILTQLHELGVQIAMDDFGTGYSSLSYFRSFRFDRIKIDRSFVSNVNADGTALAVIRAVAGLSASLGMATTAEGVETKEQLERLRAEGYQEVQGYLFSPPRPANEIASLLTTINCGAAAA